MTTLALTLFALSLACLLLWRRNKARCEAIEELVQIPPRGCNGRFSRTMSRHDEKHILTLRRMGWSHRQIAKETGWSKTTVGDVCREAGI